MSLSDDLQYLAQRLDGLGGEDIAEAAELVRKASAAVEVIERTSRAEHALWFELWGCVTRALDHGGFNQVEERVVDALKAELAGRTLTIRMSLGWLVRSEEGPVEFPSIAQFIN